MTPQNDNEPEDNKTAFGLPEVTRRTFLVQGLLAAAATTASASGFASDRPVRSADFAAPAPPDTSLAANANALQTAGNRSDKQTVGHGANVALYTGQSARFWYATHEMQNVFSASDGATILWYPDQILLAAPNPGDLTRDAAPIVDDVRTVCVTKDDVVVSRIRLTNRTDQPLTHKLEITGDCRKSADWRGGPGGAKETTPRANKNGILLTDHGVFPEILKNGLVMAVGGTEKPAQIDTKTPGAYKCTYEIALPAGATKTLTLACAFARDAQTAETNLQSVLAQKNPIAQNRTDWQNYYDQIPRFTCSDEKLSELYDFRWFLLKISTAGGDLGYFKYPVVMEGRQAFQTYCCYSAPFMAFDMNWDKRSGYGHIANMGIAAYDDGRFPWYTSPRTNTVPLDHPSKSGLSALPMTAWRYYQIHGDTNFLKEIYPWMARNCDWWISDRDANHNGLFDVDHQLETGMDDLHRRWSGEKPPRYEAIDATCYAYANLRAVAKMAGVLSNTADAKKYNDYADLSLQSLNTILWDSTKNRWLDRNPQNGERSDYAAITMFYPLFADMIEPKQMGVIKDHLLSPDAFWLPHPLPALSKADPEFDPVKRYWAGPSWPAATSHVIEGFANTAKKLDRSLMPQAAELLRRSVDNHFTPRADFYERYDPFTGRPLSGFRDYMHSWWIDIFIRHVAGFVPQDDGSLMIDPLPMGLKNYALTGAPYRGKKIDVLFNDPKAGVGLVIRVDGKTVHQNPAFVPGGNPVHLSAEKFTPVMSTVKKPTLAPLAFSPLPLGAVKPKGWLLNQLQIQANGLTGHLDEFWPSVAESAWIGGKSEGWERGPYWLDGVIPLAILLDDPKLKAKSQKWVDTILANQQADGWFGAATREGDQSQSRDNRDAWPLFILFKAFMQWEQATGDKRITPALLRAAQSMQVLLANHPLRSWAKMRWADMVTPLDWLYEKTGETYLLDLAQTLHAQGYDWGKWFTDFPAKQRTDVTKMNGLGGEDALERHGVNNAMGVKAGAIWFRHTGTPADTQTSIGAVQTLDKYHGQATGMFSGDEHLAGRSPVQGTETCTIVEYMYSLEQTVAVTGSVALADKLERVAYNALPSQLAEDMWSRQYDGQPNQVLCTIARRDWVSNGPDSNLYSLEGHFGCCTANFHQGWPKLVASLWMKKDNGLAAVAYGPCSVQTDIAGTPVTIDETTDYPFRDTVTFTVTSAKPTAFPLHLRIPEWADGATIAVNGEAAQSAKAGAFAAISRTWKSGDRITLRLPMPVRREPRDNNAVVLVRGPLVMALQIGEDKKQIRGELPHADFAVRPTTAWNVGLAAVGNGAKYPVKENPVSAVPFGGDKPPVVVSAMAYQIPDWKLENDSAAPPVPAFSLPRADVPVQTVELVPFGSTRLRISEFPAQK